MSWISLVIGVVVALASINWGWRQRKKLKKIQLKYASAIDIDKYVVEERTNIDAYVEQEKKELELFISEEKDCLEKDKLSYEKAFDELQIAIDRSEEELNRLQDENESIKKIIALADDKLELLNYGYYEKKYEFDSDESWKEKLTEISEDQKLRLRNVRKHGYDPDRQSNKNGTPIAARMTKQMEYCGSLSEGKKLQLKMIRLMLRAFNGECDSLISKCTWRNVEAQTDRIKRSFEAINNIGEEFGCAICVSYWWSKESELDLKYSYEEWKQEEKEEQRRIKEQIREEERALKEIEKAKRDAEKEEKRYQDALDKARDEVAGANDKQKEKLLKQISELEDRMREMEEKKRSISQAEITKTGHVYIISNVGSFGDGMFKIGMTRRLEPLDRVKELGDASVPFPFDIHAMIRTSDAPSLEKALHKQFDQNRVNLENNRKEFFYVSIEEIKEQLKTLKTELGIESEFQLTMLAEAKQYRQSEAKRIHLQKMYEKS